MASGPPVGTQKSLHLVGDDDDDGNGGTASPTASTTVSRPASRTAQPAQDGLPSGLGHGQRAVRSLTDPVRPSHWHAQGRSRFQGSALNIAVPQNLTFDEPMDMMAEDLPSQGASALWKPPLRFPPTPKTAAATTTTTTTTTPCPPPAGDGVDADLPGDQGSPLDPPDNSSDTLIDALDDASPPPMPCRPKRRSGPRSPAPSMSGRAMRQEIVSASVTTTASATIEPYSLDTPRAAPRLSGDGYGDFFPRTGDHPEDHLSEKTVRQGLHDSVVASSNETGSARYLLWPVLRHTTGVQALSSSIVTALETKRAFGRIAGPSTFRLPRRVALTDTKREAWLQQLAKGSIALRRLSKTIPHGVRGRILLEHCLSKLVPLDRALWLVKCVGANEMRIFRRDRGGGGGAFAMGGEARWVKDWTTFVEQFMEATIRACGEKGWNDRMSYVLRLAARLFADHLLDRCHYLEWALSAFHAARMDMLPIWTVVLQIFWDEMVKHRKLGKPLSTSLLEKLDQAGAEDDGIFAPVTPPLFQLTATVMEANPANFVLGKAWSGHLESLALHLDRSRPSLAAVLNNVLGRNRRLCPSATSPTAKEAYTRQWINTLDRTADEGSVDVLPERSLARVEDQDVFLEVLLDWCTTIYRTGIARVCLAARLLREWHEQGKEIAQSILGLLHNRRDSVCCKENVYLLVELLVHSGHFDAGKYLQWLIARGALNGVTSLSKKDSCDVRLLAELPLSGLSAPFLNARQKLLARVGITPRDELATIEAAKFHVATLVPGDWLPDFRSVDGMRIVVLDRTEWIKGLSRTVKCDVSLWIFELLNWKVVNRTLFPSDARRDGIEDDVRMTAALDSFHAVRDILVLLQDFSVLANVLDVVAGSSPAGVLSSIADTLTCHHDIFAIEGALENSLETVMERYERLKAAKRTDKRLARAMVECFSALRTPHASLPQLRLDLHELEHRSTAAAHSPISDDTPSNFHLTDAEFCDEIERLLSSGTSIDPRTLARLFTRIVSRIQSFWDDREESRPDFSNLLAQLRVLSPSSFDSLMYDWAGKAMWAYGSHRLFQDLSRMVLAGCLSFETVVRTTVAMLCPGHESRGRQDADLAFGTFDLIAGDVEETYGCADQDRYRLKILRGLYAKSNPDDWLSALQLALAYCKCPSSRGIEARVAHLLSTASVVSTFRRLVLRDSRQAYDKCCAELSTPDGSLTAYVERLVDPLSDHNADGSEKPLYDPGDPQAQVEWRPVRIIKSASALSLPFCQVYLRLLSDRDTKDSMAGDDHSNDVSTVEVLCDQLEQHEHVTHKTLVDIVEFLPDDKVEQIGMVAQERLIHLVAAASGRATPTIREPPGDITDRNSVCQKYLRIIETAMGRAARCLWPGTIPALADFLVNTMPPNVRGLLPAQRHMVQASIKERLPVMLRVLALVKDASRLCGRNSDDHARICIALFTLCRHDCVTADFELHTYTHDVLGQLSDDLSDECRQQCLQSLGTWATSDRARYFFGAPGPTTTQSQTAWLDGEHARYLVDPGPRAVDPRPPSDHNQTGAGTGAGTGTGTSSNLDIEIPTDIGMDSDSDRGSGIDTSRDDSIATGAGIGSGHFDFNFNTIPSMSPPPMAPRIEENTLLGTAEHPTAPGMERRTRSHASPDTGANASAPTPGHGTPLKMERQHANAHHASHPPTYPPPPPPPYAREGASAPTSPSASMAPIARRSFPIRPWELLSEVSPEMGENDSSLSLTLFEAYKVP